MSRPQIRTSFIFNTAQERKYRPMVIKLTQQETQVQATLKLAIGALKADMGLIW